MTRGFVQLSERAQGPVATFPTNDLWNLGFPRFQADSPVNDPRLSDSNGIFGKSGRKARFRAIGRPFTGKVASTCQTAAAPTEISPNPRSGHSPSRGYRCWSYDQRRESRPWDSRSSSPNVCCSSSPSQRHPSRRRSAARDR